MAYLNNIYGNSAYIGAIEGSLQGRANSTTQTTVLKAAALVFAAQVDALIANSSLVSVAGGGADPAQLDPSTGTIAANEQHRGALLRALCASECSQRPLTSVTAADYSAAAARIFAAWTTMITGLTTP